MVTRADSPPLATMGGMDIDWSSPYLKVGAVVVALVVLLWVGDRWSRWRINRWCDADGYQLVTWRGARFYEGPRKWRRTDGEDAYYVEVTERSGQPRSGFLAFDSRWWPFRAKRITMHWDED